MRKVEKILMKRILSVVAGIQKFIVDYFVLKRVNQSLYKTALNVSPSKQMN